MYALLCNYASDLDHCWPSHATLSAKLSCSVSSVKKYLSELAKAELIAIRHEQYRSCVYYILLPDAMKGGNTGCREPEDLCLQPKADRTRSEIAYLNNLSKQEENTDPPLPPVPVPRSPSPASRPVGGGGSFSHEFEKAWDAYPKKEAMGLARHAWNTLRQNGQLPSLSEFLAAITRFASTGSWQKEHGRFIPQMSNFLRGQRWLDAVSSEEEKAAQHRQLRESMELAGRREQEASEAKRKAENARVRPLYEAFKAKFPHEERSDGLESMLHGTWLFLHAKYGGPTAADVPDGNTQNMHESMKGWQRQRDEAAYYASRPAEENRERTLAHCGQLLKNNNYLSRLFPGATPVCAAV